MKGFNYLDTLPVFVLGIRAYKDYDYVFKDEEFLKIAHQTAGHACHQHYIHGKILNPTAETLNAMKIINDNWLDTDCGCWILQLDDILKYRKQLNDLLGVDCNNSYTDFEEGIYPIDYSVQNLARLQKDVFPEDLDDLIEWKDGLHKMFGSIGRWKLYILGENCD